MPPISHVIRGHSSGPVTVPLTIVLLHLCYTIQDFFVIFVAQKAKDEAPKLVTGHIQLATHRLVNQAVKILSLVLVSCAVCCSDSNISSASYLLKSDNGRDA